MPYEILPPDSAQSGRYEILPPDNSAASDFGQSLVHNVMKPLHGAAQFVENTVAKGAGMLPDNPVSRAIVSTANSDNATQQQWEQQYQKSVPDNAASYAGATVGTVLPFVVGGAAKGLQTAGDAVASLIPQAAPKVIPKVISGAVQGGIVGLINPVDNGQPYWSQKGAQVGAGATIGGTIPAVSSAVSGAYNGVKDAIAPLVNPQSVVRSGLRNWGVTPDALQGGEIVPGSRPTTAQLAANPNIVAAEKALANNPAYKPQFDARNIANNDARWSVINGIAQTPQDVQGAIQARTSATAPLRQALLDNGKPVPVAPVLDQLESLAKSPLGQRPAIGSAAQDIASQIRNFATTDAQGNVTIPPAHLDVIRQNVKDFLAKYAPNGAVGSQQQAAFEPVRTSIVDAIEGANPGYRDYLAKYAQLSQPINTMEAGQSIVDNLGNRAPNAAGAPQLTLTGLSGQVKRALDTPYGIAPEAESALKGVQTDLQRASISNSLRVPGSDTSYNLQAPGAMGRALYGSDFQGGKVLPVLGGLAGGGIGFHTGGMFGLGTGASAGAMAGKKLADFASKRVNDVLAEALLNPEVAQGLLAEAKANPGSPLIQGLLGHIPQASLVMGDSVVARPNLKDIRVKR